MRRKLEATKKPVLASKNMRLRLRNTIYEIPLQGGVQCSLSSFYVMCSFFMVTSYMIDKGQASRCQVPQVYWLLLKVIFSSIFHRSYHQCTWEWSCKRRVVAGVAGSVSVVVSKKCFMYFSCAFSGGLQSFYGIIFIVPTYW
jgi:hypothetical protein